MYRYAAKRIIGTVPLLLTISVLCFALMHVAPGGPAGTLADNPKMGADDIARIRANFGLDQPLPVQYVKWLERVVLHGDFGHSYATGEPVLQMIVDRLPATLELMLSAFIIALIFAMILGVAAALNPNSKLDMIVTVLALVALSIPVFWSGLMAMMLFSVKWPLLPSAGMSTIGEPFSIVDHVRHLILPASVLSLVLIAGWSRYVRESFGDVLQKDFIRVARAKGVSPLRLLTRHVMRNAALPLLTVVALELPLLFTGAVVTETVFSWPGMGRLFYDGLQRMDYSRLMGIVVISSVLIVVTNLIVDILYGFFDPRIRYAR